MNQVPQISDNEWEVMKIIWAKSPLTANQVIEALEGAADWKPNTVKTFISRLVKKNALGFSKDGREYYYYPLVSEKECVRAESHSFLKKVYGGALNLMLANFLEEQKLSKEELQELKDILENQDPGSR